LFLFILHTLHRANEIATWIPGASYFVLVHGLSYQLAWCSLLKEKNGTAFAEKLVLGGHGMTLTENSEMTMDLTVHLFVWTATKK